jgi:uncharacterized membrane protein
MNAAVLIGYVLVPLFGVFLCIGPVVTRPTVPFGVRVPPEYVHASVVRLERRGYQWRTAVVAICATALLIAFGDPASPWTSRVVLIAEMAADLGCYWWAHRQIAKVKAAEGWFAGRRQTVVADTSWRSQPQSFPVGWLLPAAAVIAATVIAGVLRYPDLPAQLSNGGRLVAKSPVTVFSVIVGQVYVTGLGAGLLALVYRSRPDLDTADPAASLHSYRMVLSTFARGVLILLACVDLTLLLDALRRWEVYRLPGGRTVLELVPAVFGLVFFFATIARAGRVRARSAGSAGGTDRDDDRFWKAGLFYVNRDDPALLVGARFAVGWTANLGNPTSWLLIGGVVAVPVGLVIIRLATGM